MLAEIYPLQVLLLTVSGWVNQHQADVIAYLGRVEGWRGGFRLPVAVAVPFEHRASVRLAVAPFPAPSASHAACGFPALRAPAHFSPRVMRPITLGPLSPRAGTRRGTR